MSEIKAICCPDETTFNAWLAGIRLAMHGPKLKAGYDETLRKFDALVQLGASRPEAKAALVNKDLHRMASARAKISSNHLVRRWQSIRGAKNAPNISADTGVEFDVSDNIAEADEGGASADDDIQIPADLAAQPWFHGPIERVRAEELMAASDMVNGAYLVRSSTSHKGDFVLTACFDRQCYHYHIRKV